MSRTLQAATLGRGKAMELKDTVELMNSDNYKDRFKAEYYQLKIRYEKLRTFLIKIDEARENGTEVPKHDCPTGLLREQLSQMGQYLSVLERRALIERVVLKEV